MDEINQQPNITVSSLDSLVAPQIGMAASTNQPAVATELVSQDLPINQSVVELAPNPEKVSYADAQIQEIEVAKVSPNPFQPRKVFEPAALRELADSIKEHGVIQPLVVTKTAVGYEIVVGERRFRASQLAGLEKVPAIIKESMVDQTKLEVALIENIQRQELNPIEEAQAYDRLMKTFNLTQDQVAKKVGKSRPAVANTVRLLNLPAEIQRAVIEGKLMEGHARALLGLNDPEKMILMYKVVIDQNLNVRQVEGKVRDLMTKRQMDSAAPDPKLMAMESELRGKLGTQVKIQRQGQGGKITIEFFSDEELSELIHKMAAERQSGDVGYLTV
jgi:ParB family transcriptional regulator, chromosome partitioning protein